MTVLLLLPTAVSVAHACLAQTSSASSVTIAVVTSPRWTPTARTLREASRREPVGRSAAVTAGAVFLQLLVGAVMRHTKAGLAIPDFPLALGRVVPPLDGRSRSRSTSSTGCGAVVVAALVGVCASRAIRSGRAGLGAPERRSGSRARRSSRSRSAPPRS